MTKILRVVTHNGKFHADEVFATAVVERVFEDVEVVRSRDTNVIVAADMVYDVGGEYDHERRRYDHHQNGALKRADGLTRSALGLIWLHYGEIYCDGNQRVAHLIDNQLVRGIDARDNGELAAPADPTTLDYGMTEIIEQLNPILEHGETYDEQFRKAVGRATDILARLKAKAEVEVETEDMILQARAQSDDQRYAVLDRQITPPENLAHLDGFEFLVFPETTNNTWQVYAIHIPEDRFVSKHPFPESWAGLTSDTLTELTGVDDSLFCHAKRFLAVAKSREGAISLLLKALAS